MRGRLLTIVAAGVAATSLAAAPGPAAAAPKSWHFERFRVKVEGQQQNNWSEQTKDDAENCPSTTNGSGSESVEFGTGARRGGLIQVGASPRMKQFVFADTSLKGLALVYREGYERTDVGGPCEGDFYGDEGGAPPPPAPDCGSRSAKMGFVLDFDKRDHVALSHDPALSEETVFANCPIMGTEFDELLTISQGKILRAELPWKSLFKPGFRKRVVDADGRQTNDSNGVYTDTTIHWKLTIRRVIPKPRG